MRQQWFLLFVSITLHFTGFSQATIQFNGKKIHFDSLFIDYYYAFRFRDAIPTKDTYQKNTRESISWNYLKALQLREQEKYAQSNQLLSKQFDYTGPKKTLVLTGIYSLRGINFSDLYEDDESLKTLVKADSLAAEYGDPHLILFVKEFRAGVYLYLGNIPQAKKVLEGGFPLLKKDVNTWGRVRYLNTYASTLNQLAVSRKNSKYANRAAQLLDSVLVNTNLAERSDLKGRLLSELGFSFSVMGKHQYAIVRYNEALAIFKDRYPDQYYNLLITIFHEYYNNRDYPKVIKTGENILSWIDSYAMLAHRKKEVHQVLANVYEKTGDYKKALHHTHKLLHEVEKQNELRYSKDVAELEEKYESVKKEHEIVRVNAARKSLSLDKKLLEKDRSVHAKQFGYLVVVLIIIGILLLIAILLSVQFRIAKKRIETQSNELSANNIQLAGLIRDKEFLFKELHHRVKNNFQLMVGFLRLQEKYSGNQSIENFIRQSEMKLNAMAMVHEMLYREQTNELVDIRQYLCNLGESIIGTASVIDVEFSCEGDTVFLPIDKAIPIGLVTNEIIFNSLKHTNQEELTIQIVTTKIDEQLLVEINDDGEGFKADFDPATSNSLGVKAIQLLMAQIGGTTEWRNDNGAHWFLKIPLQ
ncbi:MAG: sensor histidine kinase [Bacteroidota bacterium]